MSTLTPEVCDSLQECFCSFAVNGVVPYRQIPQLFQMVGFQLSKRQTSNLLQQVVLNRQNNLEFLDFLTYLSYMSRVRCSRQQMIDAFRSMDHEGTGKLHVNQLRQVYICGAKNKKLELEFDQIVKSLNVLNNELNYEDFVERRFGGTQQQ